MPKMRANVWTASSCNAGHALQQHVSAREQGDQELMRDDFHADHDLVYRGQRLIAQYAQTLGALAQGLSIGVG